ncbi:hypothetical protein [Dielma fastidiosa]|uniref:hypothetical protein n=1 Tax=Dielma fastidiosa TaxID=1034346 RepID=UPI0023F012DD|nr:hypothetical protein [Dielma fastidiosa]
MRYEGVIIGTRRAVIFKCHNDLEEGEIVDCFLNEDDLYGVYEVKVIKLITEGDLL